MKILDLACNRCGASLDVPAKVTFVTCAFCGAKLKVEHSGSAVYTETLEQIADELGELRRQAEIDRLDRRWQMRRDELLVTTKHGARHVPSRAGSTVMLVVIVAFGIFWTVTASSIAGPFGLFGLVFIAFGVFTSLKSMSQADAYQREYAEYQAARRELMGG